MKGEKNDSEEIKLIMIPKLNYDNTLKAEFRSPVTRMIRRLNAEAQIQEFRSPVIMKSQAPIIIAIMTFNNSMLNMLFALRLLRSQEASVGVHDGAAHSASVVGASVVACQRSGWPFL